MQASKTAQEPTVDLDAVGLVKKRLDIATVDTKIKFTLWNQIDLIYNGSGKQQTTNAQIHNPYSWSNVETIVPRMVARKPSVVYQPRIIGDPTEEDRAKNLQALFDYWWEKDRAFSKMVAWVKDALIYGTGIVKIYWKKETESIKGYEYGPDGYPKVDKKTKRFVEQTQEITTYDDPCLENVDPYNFFVDPNATEVQDANWVLHRYTKSIDELEELGFDNLDDLKANIAAGKKTPSTEDNRRHEASFGRYYTEDDTVDQVTCVEMWDEDGYTVVAINAGIELKPTSDNPFWHARIPFIKLNDSLIPHEFYGKGEIEPVIRLQYALDTLQNQIIDYKTQILNPMWKVKGTIDETELVYRPNGVIHMDQFGEADAHQPVDITATGTQEKESLKQDIQQALGIYDFSKGGEQAGNNTATGIGLVQEAANARFNHKIQLLEEAVKDLGFFVMALYQQFITDDKEIAVTGPDGKKQNKKLKPAEVAGDYTVDVEAGSSQPIDKNKERADALELYQIMQPVVQDPTFQLELEKHLLSNFSGTQDLEATLEKIAAQRTQQAGQPTPEQQQAEQQHQQQMQQAAQAHQQSLQLKMLEIQSRIEVEKMKSANNPAVVEATPHPLQKISESLNYKDAPADIQRQMEAAAGFSPSGIHPQTAVALKSAPQPLVPDQQPVIATP